MCGCENKSSSSTCIQLPSDISPYFSVDKYFSELNTEEKRNIARTNLGLGSETGCVVFIDTDNMNVSDMVSEILKIMEKTSKLYVPVIYYDNSDSIIGEATEGILDTFIGGALKLGNNIILDLVNNLGVLKIVFTKNGDSWELTSNVFKGNAYKEDIDDINSKIPNQASSSNQLADKNFVNSSIGTNTATFKGTYTSLEEAEREVLDADINDYIFISTTDEAGNTLYNRYKWGDNGWAFEYSLNNSGFTAEQWAAINSGITSENVLDVSDVILYSKGLTFEDANKSKLRIKDSAGNNIGYIGTDNGTKLNIKSENVPLSIKSGKDIEVLPTYKFKITSDKPNSSETSKEQAISVVSASEAWITRGKNIELNNNVQKINLKSVLPDNIQTIADYINSNGDIAGISFGGNIIDEYAKDKIKILAGTTYLFGRNLVELISPSTTKIKSNNVRIETGINGGGDFEVKAYNQYGNNESTMVLSDNQFDLLMPQVGQNSPRQAHINASNSALTLEGDTINISGGKTNTTKIELDYTGITFSQNNEIIKLNDLKNALEITYSDLKTLRDTSKLIPGKLYKIIDYICTTSQEGTYSAYNRFDIIVTADSINTLNENARACLHSGDLYFRNSNLKAWQLKYSLDNNTTKFAWATTTQTVDRFQITETNEWFEFWKKEDDDDYPYKYAWKSIAGNVIIYTNSRAPITGGTTVTDRMSEDFYGNISNVISNEEGRGVIYWMKDEFNNEAPYDFKNIKFKRYKVASYDYNYIVDIVGKYVGLNSTIYKGATYSNDYLYFYTFTNTVNMKDNSLTASVHDNIINNYSTELPDIVLRNQPYNNIFGLGCCNSDFNNCRNNVILEGCNNNLILEYCYNNNIMNEFADNIISGIEYCNIGKESSGNVIHEIDYCNVGLGFQGNIMRNNVKNTNIGNYVSNNTFEFEVSDSYIGNHCRDNAFGGILDSTIKDYFQNNDSGLINRCHIGNHCQDNVFSTDTQKVIIGDYCKNNLFNAELTHINIGNNFKDNNQQSSLVLCTILDNCSFNTFDANGHPMSINLPSNTLGETFKIGIASDYKMGFTEGDPGVYDLGYNEYAPEFNVTWYNNSDLTKSIQCTIKFLGKNSEDEEDAKYKYYGKLQKNLNLIVGTTNYTFVEENMDCISDNARLGLAILEASWNENGKTWTSTLYVKFNAYYDSHVIENVEIINDDELL